MDALPVALILASRGVEAHVAAAAPRAPRQPLPPPPRNRALVVRARSALAAALARMARAVAPVPCRPVH